MIFMLITIMIFSILALKKCKEEQNKLEEYEKIIDEDVPEI